ncbi:unnamed protein product [Rotaria socialis]
MDLFQLNELTDDMMNLCNNDFYNFLKNSLNKDLCELFRVQAIRHMTSLSSITIDQIIEILTLDIGDLNNLKKSLGFVTSDEKFHVRLDHRNLLERLLLLVKSKTNSSMKNSDLSNQYMKEQIHEKCLEMWRKTSNSSNVIECELRLSLLKEYSRSTSCNYIFVAEDATRSISCIDYDVQSNSFIGFSAPLVNGVPQSNFFRTEKFNVLKEWFDEADTSKFINLHMAKSLKSSAPSFILCAYGSNNKFEAIDVLRRWLYIYHESLIQGLRVIGFSTDGDSRYLRAMRLCSRFFVELPNSNLFKYNDQLDIKIPDKWSWFFMKQQQIFLFMQDPIHIATKIRNRLLSKLANLKMGDFSTGMKYLAELIETKSKIEHNLIKSDLSPKDRQSFASCLRISSELVLDLLNRNENAKGTYVYLTLLNLIISGFINKLTSIEDRLYHILTVVFVCRLWFSWIHYFHITKSNKNTNSNNNNNNSQTPKRPNNFYYKTNILPKQTNFFKNAFKHSIGNRDRGSLTLINETQKTRFLRRILTFRT